MGRFFIFIFIIFSAVLLWGLSFPRSVQRENFINEKVLAKTYPLNVRIDVDYIKSLRPAYEWYNNCSNTNAKRL